MSEENPPGYMIYFGFLAFAVVCCILRSCFCPSETTGAPPRDQNTAGQGGGVVPGGQGAPVHAGAGAAAAAAAAPVPAGALAAALGAPAGAAAA